MHWWLIVSDCWDLHMLKRITQYCIKLFLKRAKKEALQEMINEANTQNIIDVNEHSNDSWMFDRFKFKSA